MRPTFVGIAKDAMKKELEEGSRVIVSIVGGRKTMGVGLYKAGVELGIEEVYHVIAEPTSSNFFKNLMMYDLKAMFEGRMEVPEKLKEYIRWESTDPM